MLFKHLSAAALLVATAFSTPLTVSIEITDEKVPVVAALSDLPLVDAALSPKRYIEYSTKVSGIAHGRIESVKNNRDQTILDVLGALHSQYKLFATSHQGLAGVSFDEKNGTEVVDAFYYLAEALKGEFDLVVERKEVLTSFDALSVFVYEQVQYLNTVYIGYNDELYSLLPTDELKDDFTNYSSGVATSIGSAIDALAPIKPHHAKNKYQIEL